MYDFEYLKPMTLAGVTEALKKEGAQALAGGQSLLPTLKQRLGMPSVLVDVKAAPAMVGVAVESDVVTIKAATTHAAVEADAGVRRAIPGLADLAGRIGDPQVRNRGTIGGSLANNDPSACYPAAALALGATIVTDRREIAADDYFQGMFATALEEGELVTAVKFPIPERSAYAKFDQPASRFALTGVMVAKSADGVRVAVTGASANGVFRHKGLEDALTASYRPEAVDAVTVSPAEMIEDLHGTPAYRANLVKVMCRRAVAASLA